MTGVRVEATEDGYEVVVTRPDGWRTYLVLVDGSGVELVEDVCVNPCVDVRSSARPLP